MLLRPASIHQERFRQRIRLAMTDWDWQRAYWDTHVTQRRPILENALRRGVYQGILRPDLDPVAGFDLLVGLTYYQVIVRGEFLDNPAARRRCEAGFEIAWRGMTASAAAVDPGVHRCQLMWWMACSSPVVQVGCSVSCLAGRARQHGGRCARLTVRAAASRVPTTPRNWWRSVGVRPRTRPGRRTGWRARPPRLEPTLGLCRRRRR